GARLVLEEVAEPAAEVGRACRVGRGVALDRDAERERGAGATRILVRQPLGDGLSALEAPARVEVGTLATGMDGGAAVRALFERSGRDRQDRAARPTPGDGVLGEHPAAPRSVGGRRRWRSARLGVLVPVTLLTVLSVGHASDPLQPLLPQRAGRFVFRYLRVQPGGKHDSG